MTRPRAPLVAAGMVALLVACVQGSQAREAGSQGLEFSQNRKMISLRAGSRFLVQYSATDPQRAYTQRGFHQPGYTGQDYSQQRYPGPYNAQTGYGAASYPGTRGTYPPQPGGYRGAAYPTATGQSGYGPTMMGRLFQRITGIEAKDRPPLGDRFSSLMNGLGSVIRTVGEVFNVISMFSD